MKIALIVILAITVTVDLFSQSTPGEDALGRKLREDREQATKRRLDQATKRSQSAAATRAEVQALRQEVAEMKRAAALAAAPAPEPSIGRIAMSDGRIAVTIGTKTKIFSTEAEASAYIDSLKKEDPVATAAVAPARPAVALPTTTPPMKSSVKTGTRSQKEAVLKTPTETDTIKSVNAKVKTHATSYFKTTPVVGKSMGSGYTEATIEIVHTEGVPGWTGRYRTEGEATVEPLLNARAYSQTFEVVTEIDPKNVVRVVETRMVGVPK